MKFLNRINLRSPSVISLILVNLLLLVIAIILQWSAYEMVLAYWIENLVIGFYFLLKIGYSFLTNKHKADGLMTGLAIFFMAFFCVHYGMFCLGHGVFIVALIGQQSINDGLFFGVFNAIDPKLFWITIVLMFISHGISFFTRFIRGKEANIQKIGYVMFAPYKRIILVHVYIMLCGFLLVFLELDNALFMTVFVLLKIGFDLKQHLKEHQTNVAFD